MSKTALPSFWCFNRSRDAHLITAEKLDWDGPFAWPGCNTSPELPETPECAGVYLLTFEQANGYILRSAGITSSMKRRFREHERLYLRGDYTILDVDAAQSGLRREHWHGWQFAKSHPELRQAHLDFIRSAAQQELAAYRVFIGRERCPRRRARIEFALIHAAYTSGQPWGDLVDGGMSLHGRHNDEIPIRLINTTAAKVQVHGLPDEMEI